jgi:hypothetical protein
MMKDKWQTAAAALLIALVVGYMLGQAGGIRGVQAQSASSGDRVTVAMSGQIADGRAPFVVVDPLEETIMVYEWDIDSRVMYLRAIRSYRYDKMVNLYGNADNSPTVRDVQRQVERGR